MTRLGVVLMAPPEQLARAAAGYEEVGVDSLWLGEYFASAIARAAVVATATRRVTIGTNVLQAFARSPLATALAAQDLQDLSGGRFVLGLGSQVPAANAAWHGTPTPRPLARLREVVAGLRALFAAEPTERVRYGGDEVSFDVPGFRSPRAHPPPPILIGGAGARTVELAAEVADGVLGHVFWTTDHVARSVAPAFRSGARPRPVSIVRLVGPAEIEGAPADLARRVAHYAITAAYVPVLERAGITVDRSALLACLRSGDDAGLVELTGDLRNAFCITDVGDLERTMAAADGAGVTDLVLFVPVDARSAERIARYDGALREMIAAVRPAAR